MNRSLPFEDVTSRATRAALLKHVVGAGALAVGHGVTSRATRAALLKLELFLHSLRDLPGHVTSRATRAALLKHRPPDVEDRPRFLVTSRATRAALLKRLDAGAREQALAHAQASPAAPPARPY